MRPLKPRLLLALLMTPLMTVLGTLVGMRLGEQLTIRQGLSHLDHFAGSIVDQSDASSTEARRVLEALSHPTYPLCSDQDLDQLRQISFSAEYLKDAGRTDGNRILCSATLGRLAHPLAIGQPVFTQPDGSLVFWNDPLVPFERGFIRLQMGKGFVLFNAHTHLKSESPTLFTLAIRDQRGKIHTRHQDRWIEVNKPELIVETKGIENGMLHASQCSDLYFNCVTAYLPVRAVYAMGKASIRAIMLACAVTGALFGALLSLLYWRSHGLEHLLRRAIRRNDLQVVYQPILHLETGRIVAAEALSRWRDEEGTPVSPEVFIRIAEARGFISEISKLVLHRALDDFRQVFASDPAFGVGINLSAGEVANPAFAQMIIETMQQAKVAPHAIAFELTETSTASHSEILSGIQRLRQAGHTISIDDFGTGYSSLSYLHELDVNTIKIDKAFTRALTTGSLAASLLPQILEMARNLHLNVVVEGIETEAEARYFAAAPQPIWVQGFYFGRPMSIDEFLKRYRENIRQTQAPHYAA